MVKLTVFTAQEKRKFNEQRAREEADRLFKEDRAKRIAFEQQRAQQIAQERATKKYYDDLIKQQNDAKVERERQKAFNKKIERLKLAQKERERKAKEAADLLAKQRERLLQQEKATDGLTPEEMETISNMTSEELKAAIQQLENELFEAGRRRGVDDTDALATDSDNEDDPPNTQQPSVSKAQLIHAIDECDRAYFPDKIPVEERPIYRVLENEGAQAIVKRHETAIPSLDIKAGTWEISFRGTQFPDVKTGMYNAIADLNSHIISLDHAFVALQLYSDHGPVQLETQGVTTVGFAKHLDDIYANILNVITEKPEYDIIVNGHSLGAVTGQLFALRLFLTGAQKVKRVYAFASPRGFDTLNTYVAQNLEFIHILDERDPITYMYTIFYESHAGFKIILREDTGLIEFLNDDQYVPWCIKDKDESAKVYSSRQVTASRQATKSGMRGGVGDSQFAQYWFKNVGVMNQFFKRSAGSFLAFIKQFQYALNLQGGGQFLSRITSTGDTYHYIPEYRKLIDKLGDEPHFFTRSGVDYKQMRDVKTFSPGKEKLHFTDYWQLKSAPTLPEPQTPEQTPEQQISQNLADYITGDMLVNGFIVYNENAKNKHENNFITY